MTKPNWSPTRVKLGAIQTWQDNPRMSTKAQAKRIIESERKFNQVIPFILSPSNILLDGHQRLAAWLTVYGADHEMDAMQADRELSDEEHRELVITLHTGATGEWNWQMLSGWDAPKLQAWGMDKDTLKGWNNDANNLKELLKSEQPSADAEPQIDRAAELLEKWQVQTGDLWQIGEHRLICGDCTDAEVVARVMDGEKAAMMFTDPPYGISFAGQLLSNTTVNGVEVHGHKGRNTKHDAIENDALSGDELEIFCATFLEEAKKTQIRAWYVCFSQLDLDLLLSAMRKVGLDWKSIIAWVKNQATLSNKDYKLRYEPIVYGQTGGVFYGERYHEEDVWEITRTLSNDLHPTMKPVDLVERAVRNSSQENDLIYEPFSGSGTTLVACQNLSRRCRAIEISPAYVAVALERMATAFPHLEIRRI